MAFLQRALKPALSHCCMLSRRCLGTASKTANDVSRAAAANQKLREDLALSYRALAYYNLHEGVDNHLSVRAPARSGNGEVMLIISHGTHWTQMRASDLIGVDFESAEVMEGDGEVELFAKNIHLSIHKAKASEGVKCVMHTHQPYTTALACCLERLKNCHQTSMRFHNKISYDDSYGDLTTDDEGQRLAKAFAGKDILLMAHHGVTACGRRICDVFDDLYYLERACMYQVLAMSTGKTPVEVPDHIAELQASYPELDYFREAHLEAMRPIIDKMGPDYRS